MEMMMRQPCMAWMMPNAASGISERTLSASHALPRYFTLAELLSIYSITSTC